MESLSFTKTLYAFDFDGTLSKIVRVPSEAAIAPTTEALLRELSELAPVALVSGRSVDDLKQRIGFKPRFLVGNHGLEGLANNTDSLKQALADTQAWKGILSQHDFDAGVEIEDKDYSLAIHYRRSRNKKKSKDQIREAISKLSPAPRLIAGKCVYNLLPSGAPHKGVAVLELMQQVGAKHCFYIGDDDTDEDVFSLPDSKIMTVRVGEKKTSHARYFIDRQSQINQLLKQLIRYHQKTPQPECP